MTNVIQLKRNAQTDNEAVLRSLLAQEERGELLGFVHLSSTSEGDRIGLAGAYANRLQSAAFALVKGLSVLTETIAAAGDAGHTRSPMIVKPLPGRRTLPRRLTEVTDFGELSG